MSESQIPAALADSVRDVLEKMFFIDVLTPSAGGDPRPHGVAVQVRFEGHIPGTFRMDIDRGAAAAAASGFLGEDPADLTGQQIHEVACELANMICGSVLSRVESSAVFRLASPEIVDGPVPCPPAAYETSFQAGLDGGALRAEIRMERPLWTGIAAPAF